MNNLNNIELRRCNAAPELRVEVVNDEHGRARRYLSGYAVLFEQYSRSFWDEWGEWVEIIDRNAFANADMSDVVMVVDHSREVGDILARSKDGVGTLEMSIDDNGIMFRFPIPDTTAGRDLYELIARGDVTECSFAFWVRKDQWTYDMTIDSKKMAERRIIEVEKLADLSIVMRGQYSQTSVGIDERALARSAREASTAQKTMSVATAKAICNL